MELGEGTTVEAKFFVNTLYQSSFKRLEVIEPAGHLRGVAVVLR